MSAAGTPKTWFAGKSAPEDKKGIDPSTFTVLALFLISPLGSITALVGYWWAFSYRKWAWTVLAQGTAGVFVLWLLVDGLRGNFLARYLTGWREAIAAVKDGSLAETAKAEWLWWLLAQTPLSLLLGSAVATVYSWWKWTRRPHWEANDRRPGPRDLLRLRRTVTAIATDTDGPDEGATLGHTPFGHRVVQTGAEASAHTLVAGGSGAGKTTTMLVGIRDAIRRGEPVLFVDLKGAVDVPAQLAEWSDRYNRKFLHWTIQDPRAPYEGPAAGPAFYDPIGRGDPSRRKDLLIGSQKWDVEYYKTVVANYLQIAFQVSDRTATAGVDSFTEITELLNYEVLTRRAVSLIDTSVLDRDGINMLAERQPWQTLVSHIVPDDLRALLEAVMYTVSGLDKNEQELSAIRNMRARLQVLTQSTAGAWLRRSPDTDRNIDLRRVVDEGWVVVVSLDSSNYEETAKQIGGLVIQDLKTLSSELRHKPADQPLHVYIDEFSAIGSDNVLGLLARARDAKIPVTLSTQAIADLTRADPSFPNQVMGVISSFIIHRANMAEDAEIFAGLTGEHTVFRTQYGIEMTSGMPGAVNTGAATGTGMIREDKEFRVPAEEFQQLPPGRLIYIAKAPTNRIEREVTVIREDANLVALAGPPPPQANPAPRTPDTPPPAQAPTSPLPATESVPDWPDGADAHASRTGEAPAEARSITPAQAGYAPVADSLPRRHSGAPRRQTVPKTDLTASVHRPAPTAPSPTAAQPSQAESPGTGPGQAAPLAASTPTVPPAPTPRPELGINPAAFQTRAVIPTAPGAALPPRPASATPLPAPAPIASRPASTGSLPITRPAPLTAPWLNGESDELGNALPGSEPAPVEEDGSGASAFGVPEAGTDWAASTWDAAPATLPVAPALPAVLVTHEVETVGEEPQGTPIPPSARTPVPPPRHVDPPEAKAPSPAASPSEELAEAPDVPRNSMKDPGRPSAAVIYDASEW